MTKFFPANNNFEITLDVTRACMNALIDAKILMPRRYVRKLDTIDVTRYAVGCDDGNPAAMPNMQQTEEEKAKLKEYWCLAVPPLLYGVVLINKARYLVYEVSDINLDDKTYHLSIIDYGYEYNTWMVNGMVDATIHCDERPKFTTRLLDMYDIFNMIFVKNKAEQFGIFPPKLSAADLKRLKEVALPMLILAKEKNQDKDLLNHFLTAIVRVNCELQSGPKPKAVRSKKSETKVKTVTDKEPERNPKPQIVRTLASGVTIKSAKIPKAPTVDIIRHYKVASWSVRGHMRHYKNGKTVYITPSVHKRKEFENTDATKRQTIIISGRRN